MKISANQLESHLKNPLLPCYLVTGDEPLLVQEALGSLRTAARNQGFSAREIYFASTGFDWNELSGASSNLSLFAEKRIVELRLPTGKPGIKGSAAIVTMVKTVEMIEQNAAELLFIVSAPKLDRNAAKSKWVKALGNAGGLIQLWPVSPRELPAWLNARMRQVGLQPDRDAVRLIADRVEGNLLAAQQEIEKLRLVHGEGPVSAEAVDAAVADSSRFDVYKLVDAAVGGNAQRAIRILGGVRNEGVDAVIVMWALTREIRSLATLSDSVCSGADLGAAMRQARIWQNRQSIVRACVGRHQPGVFYGLLKICRQADAAAKGQLRADPWQLASKVLLSLATSKSKAA